MILCMLWTGLWCVKTEDVPTSSMHRVWKSSGRPCTNTEQKDGPHLAKVFEVKFETTAGCHKLDKEPKETMKQYGSAAQWPTAAHAMHIPVV